MLILASQSPRRAELLHQVGIAFEIAPAAVDERVQRNEEPSDYVRRISLAKASAVRARHPQAHVIGSDTAVVLGSRILGKPAGRDEAAGMLLALAGRTHEVLTGVAVIGPQTHYRLSRSRVTFGAITPAQALAYWDTGEPADKAGGYAIQGLGAAFVERMEGSYSGIMGLPLFETLSLLRTIGVRCPIDV
jgi:septum formation protein